MSSGNQIRCLEVSEFAPKRMLELIDEIEMHCPCGARPESLNIHAHVSGCNVDQLKVLLRAMFWQEQRQREAAPDRP